MGNDLFDRPPAAQRSLRPLRLVECGEVVGECGEGAEAEETCTVDIDLADVRRRRRDIPLVREARLGQLAYAKGQERSSHLDRALALVADAPPSHSKAVVLSHGMMHLLVADRNADALQVAREGLAMARSLGDRDVEAAALGTIGAARVNLGDPGGIADLER